MPNLEALYACNPSFVINLYKEETYCIDLAAGRGEDVVKRLRRAIALSPNKPTYQLLAGHIGSGKTTELLRLKAGLEQQGFDVIYCAADQYLQINDVGLAELWLVILNLILQHLEKKEDSLSLAYLPNAITEIEQWMRMSPPIGVSNYVSRLQRILQALQDHYQQRRQLRHYLEPRLKNSLLAAGEEVTAIAVNRIKQLGKKGLVILIDNLDRLPDQQIEVIFGEGSKYLRQFQCHTIFTLPIRTAIAQTNDQPYQQTFQQTLTDSMPILLPTLTICDRFGVVNSENLSLLRQIVLARMLQKIAPEQRLQQVTNVFDHLETLNRLCVASYGHLPYLLSLLYGCLQFADLPINLKTLNNVLEIDLATRLSTISDLDRQCLQECLTSPHALTPDALNLCRRLLLFEHHDEQGYWFSSLFSTL
jgi:hypothetical protein